MIQNVSQDTVGVVLAVNGKNTLFQEDLTSKPVAECTKWVLGPGETYTVEGFYMTEDGKDVRAFKVLSNDESAKADLAARLQGGLLDGRLPLGGGRAGHNGPEHLGGRGPVPSPILETERGRQELPEIRARVSGWPPTARTPATATAGRPLRITDAPRLLGESSNPEGGPRSVVEHTESTTGWPS